MFGTGSGSVGGGGLGGSGILGSLEGGFLGGGGFGGGGCGTHFLLSGSFIGGRQSGLSGSVGSGGTGGIGIIGGFGGSIFISLILSFKSSRREPPGSSPKISVRLVAELSMNAYSFRPPSY